MKQLFSIMALLVLMSCTDKTTGKSGGSHKDVSVKSNKASNAAAEKMLKSFYTEYIMQGDVAPTDKARMAGNQKILHGWAGTEN
ncbi:hypothetical protein [Flavobacterium album]|uniref:hypothetical protein n=1 Tax=Flavobacterium album TaxID=2175091 RepID=UPI0011B1DD28|nr:hypothetical protein [Flavobacterium album]